MFNLNQVSENFKKNFSIYQSRKLAVYGTGNNAKAVLLNSNDYNIVCVVEKEPRGGSFSGKPIVSIDEAISLGVDIVVIAAEADIEIIIYRRISEICHKNSVKVLGLHLGDIGCLFSEHKIYGYEADDVVDLSTVKREIDKHDVISFDIFDTLIMRRTLIPLDVFLRIQEISDKSEKELKNFQFRRIHSEIASGILNPSYDEIYQSIEKTYDLSNETALEYKKKEIETEENTIVRKPDVIELYEYAKKQGKRLFLISDMYLSVDAIEKILSRCGIDGYEEILVSNIYRSGKSENLYENYREKFNGGNFLHIGDHPKSDGLSAIMNGIDAIVLTNSLDLFKASQCKQILNRVDTINERSLVGMFAKKMFSNPFERHHEISDAREYGYLFLGPLISVFMTWLIEEIKKEHYTKILFAARDGYLFLELYKKAIEILNASDMPEGIYLYTSRRACLRSYCNKKEGLQEILNQYTFSLNDVSRNFSESDNYEVLSEEEIYRLSSMEYEGYKTYLKGLNISDNDNVGIVDLVSGGTCQYYLENMFFKNMTGLYLCRVLSWVKRPPYIKAFTSEHPQDPAAYFSKIENLTLLEAVMTSREPSLAGFSVDGKTKFLKDKSSDAYKNFVAEVQSGITDFFEEYLRYMYVEGCPVHVSILKELMEFRNVANISDSILSNIYLEDELLGVQFGRVKDNAANN